MHFDCLCLTACCCAGSISDVVSTAPGSKGHSWVTVTTAGQVIQLATLSEHQHQLLAALQHVMAKHPVVAPLSGCDLNQYRAAQGKPQHRRLHQAEGGQCKWLDGLPNSAILKSCYCSSEVTITAYPVCR